MPWYDQEINPGNLYQSKAQDPTEYESAGNVEDYMNEIFDEYTEIKAVIVGHQHCDDFCCKHKNQYFCYGRHSGKGGYNCGKYEHFKKDKFGKELLPEENLGLRFIEFDANAEEGQQMTSWIRLDHDGETVQRMVLA